MSVAMVFNQSYAVAPSCHSIHMTIWDICNIQIYKYIYIYKALTSAPWFRMEALLLSGNAPSLGVTSSLQAPALLRSTQLTIKE